MNATVAGLLAEVAALDSNPNVFECAKCGEGPYSECVCSQKDEENRVFVGRTPCDGDAWGAAGDLLDLVQRLAGALREMEEL